MIDRARLSQLRRYLEPALFGVVALAQALIVLLAARPPLRDGPAFEVTFYLLGQGRDARGWFTTDVLGSQGSLLFASGGYLARFFTAQTAYQLLLASAVLAFPLSFRALSRSLGRGALLSWLVLPLTFHAGFFLGELRMVFALPLALLQLACTASLLRSRSVGKELALIALSIALSFTHSGLWLAALALAFVALLFGSDVPLLVRARAPFAAGLCVVAITALLEPAWLQTFDDDFRLLLADCEPSARLRDYGLFTTFTLVGDGAERLTKAWAVLIAFSVAFALTHAADLSEQSRRLRLFALSSGALAFFAFILTPVDFDVTWGWGVAWSGLSLLLFLVALPLPSGHVRKLLLCGFVVIGLWRAEQVRYAFAAFHDEEFADFHDVLRRVKKRRHLLFLMDDPNSKYVHAPAFVNYAAFYHVHSPEGLAAPVMGDLPGWPLVLRESTPRPPLPEQQTLFATGYVYPATLDWADFVLTRGEWLSRPESRTKIFHDGKTWKIYRVMPQEESVRRARGKKSSDLASPDPSNADEAPLGDDSDAREPPGPADKTGP